MNNYLVTYDLNKEGYYYSEAKKRIETAIKSLDPSAVHCVTTTWFLRSRLSTKEISDYIRRSMDSNDSILVVKFVDVAGNLASSAGQFNQKYAA